MIDDAQLKRMEAENIACGDVENEWLVRNARRYLAKRDDEIATFAELAKKGIHVPLTPEEHRAAYDAAADRLLEGGE